MKSLFFGLLAFLSFAGTTFAQPASENPSSEHASARHVGLLSTGGPFVAPILEAMVARGVPVSVLVTANEPDEALAALCKANHIEFKVVPRRDDHGLVPRHSWERRVAAALGSVHVVAFAQNELVLSDDFVKRFPVVLNHHIGLLPEQPGVNAIEQAIRMGMNAGATIHQVTTGVDAGNIFGEASIPTTGQRKNIRELVFQKTLELYPQAVLDALAGKKGTPQSEERRKAIEAAMINGHFSIHTDAPVWNPNEPATTVNHRIIRSKGRAIIGYEVADASVPSELQERHKELKARGVRAYIDLPDKLGKRTLYIRYVNGQEVASYPLLNASERIVGGKMRVVHEYGTNSLEDADFMSYVLSLDNPALRPFHLGAGLFAVPIQTRVGTGWVIVTSTDGGKSLRFAALGTFRTIERPDERGYIGLTLYHPFPHVTGSAYALDFLTQQMEDDSAYIPRTIANSENAAHKLRRQVDPPLVIVGLGNLHRPGTERHQQGVAVVEALLKQLGIANSSSRPGNGSLLLPAHYYDGAGLRTEKLPPSLKTDHFWNGALVPGPPNAEGWQAWTAIVDGREVRGNRKSWCCTTIRGWRRERPNEIR